MIKMMAEMIVVVVLIAILIRMLNLTEDKPRQAWNDCRNRVVR